MYAPRAGFAPDRADSLLAAEYDGVGDLVSLVPDPSDVEIDFLLGAELSVNVCLAGVGADRNTMRKNITRFRPQHPLRPRARYTMK